MNVRHLKPLKAFQEFQTSSNLRGLAWITLLYSSSALEATLTFSCRTREAPFLQITTVFTLGRELVKTLKEVHAQGVIHRDIKPSNILLPCNKDPTKPYLTGFGLTTPWRDLQTGRHIGISVSLS
ncbi:hypothetical protein M405DRAFT_827215 [Rhizopogon salebrosus TDB-379]|nr:hypothetical protein M405DRAFT_828540 [Rhizopogon salebrosus TDB-379]KAJ8584176.1 hypothetical protein M405DRAFT_827215 [Rhizopogon salebrosus TDB-379]